MHESCQNFKKNMTIILGQREYYLQSSGQVAYIETHHDRRVSCNGPIVAQTETPNPAIVGSDFLVRQVNLHLLHWNRDPRLLSHPSPQIKHEISF